MSLSYWPKQKSPASRAESLFLGCLFFKTSSLNCKFTKTPDHLRYIHDKVTESILHYLLVILTCRIPSEQRKHFIANSLQESDMQYPMRFIPPLLGTSQAKLTAMVAVSAHFCHNNEACNCSVHMLEGQPQCLPCKQFCH